MLNVRKMNGTSHKELTKEWLSMKPKLWRMERFKRKVRIEFDCRSMELYQLSKKGKDKTEGYKKKAEECIKIMLLYIEVRDRLKKFQKRP